MRAESVYVIPCISGQTVESNSPTARHYCEDLTVTGDFCPWPRRYRELVIDGWGKV